MLRLLAQVRERRPDWWTRPQQRRWHAIAGRGQLGIRLTRPMPAQTEAKPMLLRVPAWPTWPAAARVPARHEPRGVPGVQLRLRRDRNPTLVPLVPGRKHPGGTPAGRQRPALPKATPQR
jgi:hypothetical protein